MRDNPFLETDRAVVGDGYTSFEAMENLTILCDDFGSRFGGTEGEKQAADFMAKKLEHYGLQNVHLEPFDYLGWRRGPAELEVLEPLQRTLACISLPHSPASEVKAELFDAGDGAPVTFEEGSSGMAGKIVMASSETFPAGSKSWVHRSEKYGRSLLNSARAFIFMNHYPAYGPATGGVGRGGKAAPIPAISVSNEDGSFLRRLLKRHGAVTLRIKTTDVNEPMVSWNVVGDLLGSEHPQELVMLGSHYDGHDISQGAQDPASGAAAVLEAARLLAAHASPRPCTLRFALWGVEEIGLFGSRAYVDAHGDELDKIRFYLNMDGAGAVNNKGLVFNEWGELETLAKEWQRGIAYPFKIDQSVNAHSDHYPFLLKGIPTGGIESVPSSTSGRGYGHTRHDTLDKVELRELQDAAVLASLLAMRLASVPPESWPVTRRSPEEVGTLLDRPEYRETAEVQRKISAFYKGQAG
jgi:Zn-dependent M28 family amino/carboxypeptidase